MSEFHYKKYLTSVGSSFTEPVKCSFSYKWVQKISFKNYKLRKKIAEKISFHFLNKNYPDIVAAQIEARENGGLLGEYQWIRLYEIVQLLKRYSPSNVCELGCGTSSLMFAKLMRSAEKFTTVEESQYWLDRMIQSSGKLFSQMTHLRADRVVSDKDGESVTNYAINHASFSKGFFDFIYVDGPTAVPMEGDKELHIKDPDGIMPNIDAELFWEKGIYPKVIVVDGRRSTVRRLIQKNNGRYKVFLKSDFVTKIGLIDFSTYRYHTVFLKKDLV